MSDIIFNPDEGGFNSQYRPEPTGGLTNLFMRLTGIQDKESVSKVMLVVAVLLFIVSGIILVSYL